MMLPEPEGREFIASVLLSHEAGRIKGERVRECRCILVSFPDAHVQASAGWDQKAVKDDVFSDAPMKILALLHTQCLENNRFCILSVLCLICFCGINR